jgi:hypothetical protein
MSKRTGFNQIFTSNDPIPNAYWKYLCLSITGNGMISSHYAELLLINTVRWIKGESLSWNLWSKTSSNLKQIDHFSHTLQSLNSCLSGKRQVLISESQKLSKGKVFVHSRLII